MGIAVFEMWLLDPGRSHLIRFGYPDTRDGGRTVKDLPPERISTLNSFQSLCTALIVWIAFAQL